MGFNSNGMVKSYALMFTGQGSQWVGMGKGIYEKNKKFREIFDRCEDVLGIPLKKICFEGPFEELTKTIFAQPAILSYSIGIYELFREKNEEKPICVFGHSLGEFTALYSAKVLSLEDVLNIVKKRGELMHKAGIKYPGSMSAVIGINGEEVNRIIKSKGFKYCVIANYNSPSQIVISGKKEEVEEVCKEIESKKIGKIIPLKVSAAFHSPLMDEPAEEFSEYIEDKTFNPPLFPVIQNVTGKPEEDPEVIKENIKKQLNSPVLFTECVKSAKRLNTKIFVEIGPKETLTKLVKQTFKEAETIFISESDTF